MRATNVIDAGGVQYPIRFGQNAVYMIEEQLMLMEAKSQAAGAPPKTKTVKVGKRLVRVVIGGMELLGQLPNNVAMHLMCWAGMESARLKGMFPAPRGPFTMGEVGDIIDEAGGVERITLPIMKEYQAAFPDKADAEFIKQLEKEAEELMAKDPNASGARSTGASGSSRRKSRASDQTSSGD